LEGAAVLFASVIDELHDHLVNPDKPRLSHLEDGHDDWVRYSFNDIGLVSATRREGIVELVLSAVDPNAAIAGLRKYAKQWDELTREWFGCEVRVQWLQRNRDCAELLGRRQCSID
jgi:hypothetical protein